MSAQTALTGVKPTGAPHIGNYVGAIRPMLELAQAYPHSFLFVADYHALNAVQDAQALRRDTREVAACYLALGLDPDRTVFYRQSDVPEIFELATLLTAVTPKGLMDRAHAYKAARDKNAAEGRDVDYGVNMGLYTYPLLMAADILVMDADVVPVGRDQIQHIEFARDIAGYFNHAFGGDILRLPVHKVQDGNHGAQLPGLDGRKMSKSYNNHIPVFMDSKQRRKLVMKIVSDSCAPEDKKNPDESVIFQLYAQYAAPAEVSAMRAAFEQGGMGYGTAKQQLFEVLERTFEEPTARYHDLMNAPEKIDALLKTGAEKARAKAQVTLARARAAAGLS